MLFEEPENMLHPDLEINFARFLISYFEKINHKFVIETHSIHILRTFQLAVAEGKISKDDISIYDFSIDEKGNNNIRKIEVLESGALSGQFATGFSDLANEMELKIWEIHNKLVSDN